jgi:hypothetical protein
MFRAALDPALDEAGLGPTTSSGQVAIKAGRWLVDQIVDGSYDLASGLSMSSFISPNGLPASTSVASSVDDIDGPWETQTSSSHIVEFEDEGVLNLDVQLDPEDNTTRVATLGDVSAKLTYLGPPGVVSELEKKKRGEERIARAEKLRAKHAARYNAYLRRLQRRGTINTTEQQDCAKTTAGAGCQNCAEC